MLREALTVFYYFGFVKPPNELITAMVQVIDLSKCRVIACEK